MRARLAAALLAVMLAACREAPPPEAPSSETRSEAPAEIKTAKGVGVITAVDAEAGTVTLDHQAIPEIGWPEMVMTFKADPALLATVKAGDQVAFDLRTNGSQREITALTSR